jgi:hypothetical protein
LQAANLGFRGFGKKGLAAWGWTLARLEYWIVLTVAALLGVWAAHWDLSWKPTGPGASVNVESVSVVLRLLLAYLLVLASWITTCSMLGACSARGADSSGKPAA